MFSKTILTFIIQGALGATALAVIALLALFLKDVKNRNLW